MRGAVLDALEVGSWVGGWAGSFQRLLCAGAWICRGAVRFLYVHCLSMDHVRSVCLVRLYTCMLTQALVVQQKEPAAKCTHGVATHRDARLCSLGSALWAGLLSIAKAGDPPCHVTPCHAMHV